MSHNFSFWKLLLGSFFFFTIHLSALKNFSPILRKQFFTNIKKKSLALKEDRILAYTIEVYIDNEKQPEISYKYNTSKKILEFSEEISGDKIEVRYRIIPENVISEYYFYKVSTIKDSTFVEKSEHLRKRFFSNEQNIKIIGNKSVSIAIGNKEDLDINQSLFLRINGQLNKHMNVQAQLSDSQSPISPEGNSKELSTLDQIFIRLYGKSYEIAFGELDLEMKNRKFLNYTPKFEGMKISYDKSWKTKNAIAISKGKEDVASFYGIDAVQGPYFLGNRDGDNAIKIVPGTEKIYLNGILLLRGSGYTIDYNEGTITFSYEHFIDSNSKIRATFQFSDENYKQNIYITDNYIPLSSRISMQTAFIQQTDDKENPLFGTLTETDIETLEGAGDQQAIASGINEVGDNLGDYVLITSDTLHYYQYVYPDENGTPQGNFNLQFYYAGNGEGNYKKENNHYVFVSPESGEQADYQIGRKLISPQSKQNIDYKIRYIGDFYQVEGEILGTYLDKNTISNTQDNDNFSYIYNIETTIKPNLDKINPRFTSSYQNQKENLSPFTDLQDPLTEYQISDSLDTRNMAYEFVENIISIKPTSTDSISISHRYRDVSSLLHENNFSFISNFKQRKFLPTNNTYLLYKKQNKLRSDNYKSSYYFAEAFTSYDIKSFHPSSELRFYKSSSKFTSTNNIGSASTFQKYQLGYYNTKSFMTNVFGERSENKSLSSRWKVTRKSLIYGFDTLFQNENHYLLANIKANSTSYYPTEEYANEMDDNVSVQQAKISSSNRFFNNSFALINDYSIENKQTFLREKELVFVGQGNGPLNENGEEVGVDDPTSGYIYEYNFTGEPELTVRVSLNSQTSFLPRNNKKLKAVPFLNRISCDFSSTINEVSSSDEKLKLYFLHPDVIMEEETSKSTSILHNTKCWYEIQKRKANLLLNYRSNTSFSAEYNTALDSETIFKDLSKTYLAELQLFKVGKANLVFSFEHQNETNSFYKTITEIDNYSFEYNRSFRSGFIYYGMLIYSKERGKNQLSNDVVDFTSIVNKNVIKASLGKKYYFNFDFKPFYNFSDGIFVGSNIGKSKGFNLDITTTINYNLNSFTIIDFSYKGKQRPNKDYENSFELGVNAKF